MRLRAFRRHEIAQALALATVTLLVACAPPCACPVADGGDGHVYLFSGPMGGIHRGAGVVAHLGSCTEPEVDAGCLLQTGNNL